MGMDIDQRWENFRLLVSGKRCWQLTFQSSTPPGGCDRGKCRTNIFKLYLVRLPTELLPGWSCWYKPPFPHHRLWWFRTSLCQWLARQNHCQINILPLGYGEQGWHNDLSHRRCVRILEGKELPAANDKQILGYLLFESKTSCWPACRIMRIWFEGTCTSGFKNGGRLVQLTFAFQEFSRYVGRSGSI